jgi:hypothetical protein
MKAESILTAALSYLRRGWRPVPIPHRSKGPTLSDWPSLEITEATAPQYFNGALQNIGLQLGERSKGLTDADLDCSEAIAIGSHVLPATESVFGRPAKPGSHWLYLTDLATAVDKAAIVFDDPLIKGKGTRLLELRIGPEGHAAQTMAPPSTHPCGELVSWERDGSPATVNGADLRQQMALLASCVLFARYWPASGAGRHDTARVVGGFLSRAGFDPAVIHAAIEGVGRVCDRLRSKELARTARDAALAREAGKRAYGLTQLRETFDPAIVNRIAAWLSYGDPEDAKPTLPDTVGFDDFRAHMPSHHYIFMPVGDLWPAASVDARLPRVPLRDSNGDPILKKNGEAKTEPASVWLDRNRPVEQCTWAPGLPPLIEGRLLVEGGWVTHGGVAAFNLYRPPRREPGNALKVERWTDHLYKLYGDDDRHIIRWLAHRIQRPEEKINHALVLGAAQGVGKDSLLEPVRHGVGPWNFAEVKPTDILGRFNGYIRSVVLRVSEAHDLGEVDRFQLYDRMKSLCAAPPDVLRCDEKNLREHAVINCTGVVITTNHRTDGIYLPPDDRRHYVAWTDLEKEAFTEDYWSSLWRWYWNGGIWGVVAYLAELDLTGFDPKAPPPRTPGWWAIVDAGRAPEEGEFADCLDKLKWPATVTLADLKRVADGGFYEWLDDRRNRRIIPFRLEKVGYVPVRNPDAKSGLWRINSVRQIIYGKTSLSIHDRYAAAVAKAAK